jgi:hypothetical protein
MNTTTSNAIYDLRFTICERVRIGLLALLGLLLLALPSAHAAGPPEAMAYQGFLVDANGNPLAPSTPANYPITFRIFQAPSGGASLWSEQQIVTVDKGNFSVILSEGTAVGGEPRPPLSTVLSTNGADRYIELSVTIGAAPPAPMLPRLRLLPMAYAFLATSANNLVSPNGVPVIRYANNRVEVAGDVSFSAGISGNGAGLTGLSATQIGTGTFADARLSANVALRAGGNTFTGNQTINGSVGIGGAPVDAALDVEGNLRLNLNDIFLREGADRNHGLGWFGTSGANKPFAGVNVDGPVLYGFSGGGLGTKNGGDKLALFWNLNGNVGIGTTQPGARLSLVAPGTAELQGSVLSPTLRTSSGLLGTSAGNEMALASFGFNSANQSSLGIRAMRVANGGAWDTTAIGLEMDVDNTVRAGGASLWLNANGNTGIGTTTPTAKLDVNGSLKATSLTVNGLTVNGPITAAALNGEDSPFTFTVPSALPGNLAAYREVLVDTAPWLGDADGGRIKVIVRNHGNRTVRTYSIEFYAEQDSDYGKPQSEGRFFWTVNSYGQEAGDQSLGKGGGFRTEVAAVPWGWMYIRNYSSNVATGAGDGPAFGFADRFKFYFLVSPNVTATVTLYDR